MIDIRLRYMYIGIFAVCAGLIGFAMYLQHVMDLEPCPLCILQRYAFIIVGLVALLAARHDPQWSGRRVYGAFLIATAGLGAGVAARHAWLEHNPPQIFDCGADLGFMVDAFPLAEALPMIFRGSGDCTEVLWRFLSLSISEWALVWFLIFVAAGLYAVIKKTAVG
jgi:disulfide bond formation protein DsbB